MPDVTIITAAYLDSLEKVRWLRELGDNLAGQQFSDWEWVVVDDASPTAPDLPKDVRVRLVRAATRSGPARCRNTAVALARSPAILCVDADDLLADTETLGVLHEAWARDVGRFFYGDLRLVEGGVPGRVIPFPEYDFQKSLDPKGIVPVTAIHSVDCWHRAGGWKPVLEAGLEDVEFWISAGAAGFCGQRLDRVVLHYRKHPQSRTAKMRAALREREMRDLIREMHPDLYDGRWPVGCCGGKRRSTTNKLPIPNQAVPRAGGALAGDLPGGQVWVQYNGQMSGSFFVKGQVTGTKYKIDGRNYKFLIWTQDATFFANQGRGKHFTVGVSPPDEAPTPEPAPGPEESEFKAPEPELATIERLDAVGAQTRGQPEPIPEPQPEFVPSVQGPSTGLEELDADTKALKGHPLAGMESLNDQMKAMLEAEGWTPEKLAGADVEELVPYPGIGKVTAARAIAEANRLWSG